MQRSNSLNRIDEKENEIPVRKPRQNTNRSPSFHSPSSPDITPRKRTPPPREIRGRRHSPQQLRRQPPSQQYYEKGEIFTTSDDSETPRNDQKVNKSFLFTLNFFRYILKLCNMHLHL